MERMENSVSNQNSKNVIASTMQNMDECIQNCLECFKSCTSLIPHCLRMGEEHASKEHIGLLSSCAVICETSAKMMMLESEFHSLTCGICAEICSKCAEDCVRLAGDDQRMKSCAEVCRRCAESCEAMSQRH
jgi:hypothetical protein